MNKEKYSLIKGKQGFRVSNIYYFYYEIIDNNTNKVIERIKSWYKTRPLTMEEREKIPSSHLSDVIITEWEPNGLDNANNTIKKLNYD